MRRYSSPTSRSRVSTRCFFGSRLTATASKNFSPTDPTRVNGARVDKPVDLADGDLLRIGSVEIGYHNLANASRVSGPICSYCKRENSPTQKDCWFCGTSLVSALSDVRIRTPLVLRAAGPPQQKPIDVFPGEILAFDAEGEASVVREEGAATDVLAIVAASDGPRLRRGARHPAVMVNGAPVVGDTALSSGDRLEIGTRQMVILANVDVVPPSLARLKVAARCEQRDQHQEVGRQRRERAEEVGRTSHAPGWWQPPRGLTPRTARPPAR